MFIIILLWSILFQCNTIFVNFLGNSKRAEYYFFFSSAYIPMYIHEWKLTNHKRNSGHNCLLLYFLPLKFLKNNFIFSLNVITNKQETIFLYGTPICEKLQLTLMNFPLMLYFCSQEEKYYIEQLSTAMNLLQILVLGPIESQVVRLCPFVY